MKILIAGGGIGGLTAALCCHHFGHDVHVFEKAPEIAHVGAGLQIPPNAMKVFNALGIDGTIAETAFRPEAIEARMGETGRFIFTIPLAMQAVERWGAPYLHIHRAEYVKVLSRALAERAPEALRMGSEITGYQQDAEKIIVRLENGREISGDVLLGADGIQSTIRAQMGAAGTPNFTGNTAWRVLVPLDALGSLAPKPTACVWMGRGRHAVTYQLYGGEVANFVGVVERSDWTRESWIERGNPGDALSDFSGWHPVITTLLKDAELGTLFRWALFDRPPLARWTDGRAALLGDAAHPMLPFLAQGAAMAVEDGWVLARELSSPGRPVDISLLAYQNQRSARTGKAQARSRANMKTFHQRTILGQLATYGPMWLAGQFAPILVHKRMDWLYGYDVTQD